MTQTVTERKIMWGDLDALGIVFYPRYYEWIDACGHLFFEDINLNLGEVWKTRNILFGLVGTSFRYFKPGRYHQKIRIITQLAELEKKKLTLKHSLYLSTDDTLMAEGLENRICMNVSDPENLRAIDIPDDIYAILEKVKTG